MTYSLYNVLKDVVCIQSAPTTPRRMFRPVCGANNQIVGLHSATFRLFDFLTYFVWRQQRSVLSFGVTVSQPCALYWFLQFFLLATFSLRKHARPASYRKSVFRRSARRGNKVLVYGPTVCKIILAHTNCCSGN